jgi:hypothetical protein
VNATQPTPPNSALNPDERSDLEQQIRHLQERLAFYEGFDALIQDNVAHARELFRLAAQEREAAASNAGRVHQATAQREAALRAECTAISAELQSVAQTVEALAQRVAAVLAEPANGKVNGALVLTEHPVAIVVHGVPSARTALSLQRFVGALPQVSDVSAREFAGGVFRLDARVRDRLEANQFGAWEDARHIQLLTERPDVIEFSLEETEVVARAGR